MVLLNKRITVSMDEKLIEQLRKIQAERIHKEARSVSLSEVLSSAVEKGLKK